MKSKAGRIIIRTFTVIFAIVIILAAFIFRAYNYGFNYKKGKEIYDKGKKVAEVIKGGG